MTRPTRRRLSLAIDSDPVIVVGSRCQFRGLTPAEGGCGPNDGFDAGRDIPRFRFELDDCYDECAPQPCEGLRRRLHGAIQRRRRAVQ